MSLKLKDSGLLFEINRSVLHPFGMALAVDDTTGEMSLLETDDDEGFVFEKEQFETGLKKYRNFVVVDKNALRIIARNIALGFIVQKKPTKE